MSNRIPPKITHFLLLKMLLLITLLTVASSCNPPENWAVVNILPMGESITSTTDVVTVRNCCDIPESKTFSCNAGTANELSIILGGSAGISAIGEVTIDPAASASLGITRGSGETLEFEPPPRETIYHYDITTVYTVKTGEAELVSSKSGKTITTLYTFRAGCSLRIEPSREHFACTEVCPTPLSPDEASPEIDSLPVAESLPTPTTRQIVQPESPTSPRLSPKPQLISPVHGEYQNPFTFRWSGSQGTEYRIILTHQNKADKRYMSDWLNQQTWTTSIPAEDFGGWRWFVTTRDGVRSDEWSFVFQPFPGVGPGSQPPVEGGNSIPQPPDPDESTVTPPYPPPHTPHNPYP